MRQPNILFSCSCNYYRLLRPYVLVSENPLALLSPEHISHLPYLHPTHTQIVSFPMYVKGQDRVSLKFIEPFSMKFITVTPPRSSVIFSSSRLGLYTNALPRTPFSSLLLSCNGTINSTYQKVNISTLK